MRSLAFVVSMALLVGVGCGAPDETAFDATDQAPGHSPGAASASLSLPSAAPTGGALSGRASAVERAVVVWPSSKGVDRAVLTLLPAVAAAQVASAPAPVLVPSRSDLARATIIVLGDTWYSATAHADGLTVTVGAAALAHRYRTIPAIAPTEELRGQRAFITQNEGIWTATWTEHGLSYTLDIECERPDEPRCADDALLRSMARELSLVGGAGVR